jgi:hypothetical protein
MSNNELSTLIKHINQLGMPEPVTSKSQRQGREPRSEKAFPLLPDLALKFREVCGNGRVEFAYAEKTTDNAQHIRTFQCSAAEMRSMLAYLEGVKDGHALEWNRLQLQFAITSLENPELAKQVKTELARQNRPFVWMHDPDVSPTVH